MGSLSNLYISQSYQSLIHLATNNTASANLIELQDGLGNSIGVAVNTNGDLFLSGSLTASLQQGYLYVGNASGKTTAFATSSLVTNINTGSLVTTSSFNSYTQSTNIRLNNLETTSASVNISISNLNSTTASQATSITNLNSATQSLFSSASLSLTTASFSGNTLTFTKGNGTTFGVVIPDVSGSTIDTGSFATTSSFNSYTQSTNIRLNNLESTSASVNVSISNLNSTTASLVTSITNLNTFSASALVSISNLNTTTASLLVETQNLELFSASALISISNLNASSASQQISIDNLNTNSASVNTSITNLNSATASLFSSASLALVTASFDTGTRNLTFTNGNTTQFSVNIPDVSGSTINTGSFATTGSNTFTGDQTLIDAGGNTITLSDTSGSLMLVAKGFTSASAHLSSSAANKVNIIFKNNDFATSTYISGSNNIFTNSNTATTGFRRQLGSSNINLFNILPEVSASMGDYVAIDNNYITSRTAAPMSIRGPISSSQWEVRGNTLLSSVSIGTSATNNAEKIVSGLLFNLNQVGAAVSIIANRNTLTQQPNITNNNFLGAITLNMASSSIDYSNNINIGNSVVVRSESSGSASTLSNNTIYVNSNLIGGNTTIVGSGSNDPNDAQGIDFNGSVYRSLIYGSGINVKVNTGLTGSNTLAGTAIIGNSLTVSGSSRNPLTNSGTNLGSAFFGRFNALDGNKALSSQTVFAVGTGTATAAASRKTGFLIDSGSNTFVEGTFNVSGSSTFTGSVNVTGSLLVNGVAITTINTGSFATTGSNSFNGDQTITGSLLVSGSNTIDVNVIGRVSITGPTSGETPRLFISSSDGAFTELSRNFNQINTTNVNGGLDAYGQIYASTSSVAGQYIGVYDNPNFNTDVEVAILVTENGSSFNDWDNGIAFGYVPFMSVAPNLGNNPAPVMTRGLQVTGSTQVQNFTASLQQGFTYVGNASGITTTVSTSSLGGGTINTGSFATTGSNSFNGNQTITGSVNITGSLTTAGNMFQVTGSFNTFGNVITQLGVFTSSLAGGLEIDGIGYVGSGSAGAFFINSTTQDIKIQNYYSSSVNGKNIVIENFSPTGSGGIHGKIALRARGTGGAVTVENSSQFRVECQTEITGSLTTFGDVTLTQGNLELLGIASYIKANNITGSWGQTNDVGGNALRLNGSLSIAPTFQAKFATGSNQQAGTAVLDGANPGTVTVSNSLVTANSIIMVSKQTLAHPNGYVAVSAKSAGSFTITSNHNGDTDTVGWFIINNS